MQPLAWLLLLMAVAIVAGYFYLRRRQQQIDASTTRDVEALEPTYAPQPPPDGAPPREDQIP